MPSPLPLAERGRVRVGSESCPPHLSPLPLGRGDDKVCTFQVSQTEERKIKFIYRNKIIL